MSPKLIASDNMYVYREKKSVPMIALWCPACIQ